MVTTIALSLGAAVFLAVGFVVQQHAAAEAPDNLRLSFRLLLDLVQRPLWLAGIGAQVVGELLGAAALGSGALALVEPFTAANLLFALPLAAVWNRRHLGRREWVGALAIIAGLAAFLAAGDPNGGSTAHLPWPNWVLSGGVIAAVVGGLVLVARRRPAIQQATILAVGAGMLYGLQDALTQRTMGVLGHGIVAVLVNWPAFTLVVVAVMGMLLAQSAFEAAPLSASLPPITAAEPLTGIAFGVGVYHEYLNLSGPHLTIELLGLAVSFVGVYLVAVSPLVSGEARAERLRASRAATACDDEGAACGDALANAPAVTTGRAGPRQAGVTDPGPDGNN